MHIPCLHCESSLWVWGQDSAFEETGWLMWGWLGVAVICKVPGPAAAFSGLCLLTRVSPPCSPPRGHPLPVFTEPTRGLGERGSPPWLESHTHPFLMCHQPQRAHSAARADPGAWSPGGHDQARRRMTARCLQPARDLGIRRHQKPCGPLSGPFLSLWRRKLVFKKLISPEAGQ